MGCIHTGNSNKSRTRGDLSYVELVRGDHLPSSRWKELKAYKKYHKFPINSATFMDLYDKP